jgi:hypothetical protein
MIYRGRMLRQLSESQALWTVTAVIVGVDAIFILSAWQREPSERLVVAPDSESNARLKR